MLVRGIDHVDLHAMTMEHLVFSYWALESDDFQPGDSMADGIIGSYGGMRRLLISVQS